ncbi:MAG: FecR domain-containing protein [Acidobacteriaceae bacterium]|nr:FecR domain-containing protein [Acidobacteriaceae bacterium]
MTRLRDEQPWALSNGERVAIRQTIWTGADGYARFDVTGGSYFELFGNSRVQFRQNTSRAGDLLDVQSGHVRVHLQPDSTQRQQRVFTSVAIISATGPATLMIGLDEDGVMRIDVIEGEVSVQHALLPRGEPVLIRAVDAIMVQKDQPISRRVDRGSLYRFTARSIRSVLSAIGPGKGGSHNFEEQGGSNLLADGGRR